MIGYLRALSVATISIIGLILTAQVSSAGTLKDELTSLLTHHKQILAAEANVVAAPTTMPEPVAKSVSMSGPYLRVDIGYGLTNDPDGTQAGGNASESGETADNVAYALMAGGTVQNSDAIALDIGYRFISLGEIE